MNEKCKAKNPATCWKHGTHQGLIAETKIRQILADTSVRYYLTEEERAEAPLKKLTATGLTLAIIDQFKGDSKVDEFKVRDSILLASHLHREDLRSNRGRYEVTPYIEHPLRNTLRAMRYGAKDESIIIGSILHDTVEDHPFEFAEKYYGKTAATEEEARDYSYAYIRETYGEKTHDVVLGMSNPLIADKYTPAVKKNVIYANHVAEAIEDPKVCVTKVCDFVDNAVGLFHNANGTMNKTGIIKRARKYLPVCDIIEKRLIRAQNEPDFPVPAEGINRMLSHIRDGRQSLQRLAETL